MIDLHIHTTYSDGDTTVENVLKKCQEKQLEYISITDHNTCKQYQDEALNQNIFSGKIIKSQIYAREKNRAFQGASYESRFT